ncbi:serine protease [Streptomyces sp. ISL-86]|uniref:trypsin-like serine peptidase n=1 Tax=Streptomyces sp. ISL-86 TaxID=2819187 RepID=UPI001BE8D906|nr:serine protease [Streptomyces sp. ISL-86]MBT2459517.1 trypsin-like peptidase domain-containing protein [Streptomyces sp. ISL-86]
MRSGSPVATGLEGVFGDLQEVAERVRKGLEEEILETSEELPPGEAASAGQIGQFAQQERAKVLSAGVTGLEKLAAGRTDEIDEDEYFGVEAIVLLEGRPAILIQGQDFPSQQGDWAVLDGQRPGIRESIARVGRVEVSGHASLDWLGTAFLVSPDVVMTNRHVAAEFTRADGAGWTFRDGMSARMDLAEELDAAPGDGSFEYEITEVVGIHPDVDMALLRIDPTRSGAAPATPLAVAADPPADVPGRPVYVIGYPAADGRRNEPEAMRRIFMDIYNVKRLQPGTTTGMASDRLTVNHDCSTLGGNSGSPVFDLTDHRVLGLHYGGRYGLGNFAVPLWELVDDPLLQRAEINWV